MTQLKNLPPAQRRETAKAFRYKRVRVDTYANGTKKTLFGKVVTVALAPNGNTSDLLILEEDHPKPGWAYNFPKAISLSTITHITEET